jgi:hypothetical protein
MLNNSTAQSRFQTSPILSSLVQSVEAEEKVIEAIISCVETNDADGVIRAAHELMTVRRSTKNTPIKS